MARPERYGSFRDRPGLGTRRADHCSGLALPLPLTCPLAKAFQVGDPVVRPCVCADNLPSRFLSVRAMRVGEETAKERCR